MCELSAGDYYVGDLSQVTNDETWDLIVKVLDDDTSDHPDKVQYFQSVPISLSSNVVIMHFSFPHISARISQSNPDISNKQKNMI